MICSCSNLFGYNSISILKRSNFLFGLNRWGVALLFSWLFMTSHRALQNSQKLSETWHFSSEGLLTSLFEHPPQEEHKKPRNRFPLVWTIAGRL